MFNFKEMFEKFSPNTVVILGTIWFIFASIMMFGIAFVPVIFGGQLWFKIVMFTFATAHTLFVVILLKHVFSLRKALLAKRGM
jgi:hypothetical protein